uniref:NADH-ubiquinone oxidoreductase chain 6 n=1 Tax=Analipus japonicus TaxID=31333 RepID=A0A8F0K1B5_9PHAE|nr:NADH dehydrogenase subunit 6 [Analipus japonicus]
MVDPLIFFTIAVLGAGLGVKVTTTQNPVYSGLYLVLLFLLGSTISFLLGLEFMALLFLLVYAGAIAVLVLFVVMMLDVKAIENPWSVKKKRLFYLGSLVLSILFLIILFNKNLFALLKASSIGYMGFLAAFSPLCYEQGVKESFRSLMTIGGKGSVKSVKLLEEGLKERTDTLSSLGDLEGFTEFFQLWLHKEVAEKSYGTRWFIEFDSSCALNDPSYLLYSTHAILLIVAGIVLLIAMVGAISLTLQKSCPESLYRQLGRESKNAIFGVKEKMNRGYSKSLNKNDKHLDK